MRARLLTVQLAIWIWGCSEPLSIPLLSIPIETEAMALVRRADEALASTFEPDYQRPFVRKPRHLGWVSKRYLEACRAGDRRSCWIAYAMDPFGGAEKEVHRNCVWGDMMSCRALEEGEHEVFEERLPGWAGRRLRCDWRHGCEQFTRDQCETFDCVGITRQECAAGIAASCWLPNLNPEDKEARARAISLASDGCRAGLLEECRWLKRQHLEPSLDQIALEQLCMLRGEECVDLSERYLLQKQLTRARDVVERICQHGMIEQQKSACYVAMYSYRDRRFPEPVPGRGRALADWRCTEFDAGDPAVVSSCLEGVRKHWAAVGGP